LWFDQQTILPSSWAEPDAAAAAEAPQGLSCAGYGSVVTVTAMMGLAAADYALRVIVGAN
jgi:tRNA A37 threonylcarbamoyladenosine dehydratase